MTRRSWLSVVALALGIGGVGGAVPAHALQEAPVAAARQKMTAYLSAQRVPGASVAVDRGGEILWSEGFGFASLEHKVPADRETRFRVGSISKTLTSIAVAKLWEEGKLELDSVRFAHGVLRGGVIGSRAVDLLLTPMTTSAGVSTGYGLGWRVKELAGQRAVGHGGAHVGATAALLLLPDLDLAVAILTNSNNRGIETLAQEIATLFAKP